jgi:hypothetical protein
MHSEAPSLELSGQVQLTWDGVLPPNPDSSVTYSLHYDQAGKAQLVASDLTDLSYIDTGLTHGQEYCYKIASLTNTSTESCESTFSNILCETPSNQGQGQIGVERIQTGRTVTTGKGKNRIVAFELTPIFQQGDGIILQATVADANTGLVLSNAKVTLAITGPESTTLISGPSGTDGIAEAVWQTLSPGKKGQVGTIIGSYTATVTEVSATGFTWDGVAVQAVEHFAAFFFDLPDLIIGDSHPRLDAFVHLPRLGIFPTVLLA